MLQCPSEIGVFIVLSFNLFYSCLINISLHVNLYFHLSLNCIETFGNDLNVNYDSSQRFLVSVARWQHIRLMSEIMLKFTCPTVYVCRVV
jgi:hypothetical protein